MTPEKLQAILEAAIMVAGHPLTISAMQNLFAEDERPSTSDLKVVLSAIKQRYEESGIELREVASGFRFQAKAEYSPWLSKLWEERAARYSRAFMETLSIIAYRQPITRAEIEEIRGVTVSTNIMKTLTEREWVRCLGHRDVPGKPAIYGTTKTFLDYFNLKSLSELPILAEFKDLHAQEARLQVELALDDSNIGPDDSESIPAEREALEHGSEHEHAVSNEDETAEDVVAKSSEEDVTTSDNHDISEAPEVIASQDEVHDESTQQDNNVIQLNESAVEPKTKQDAKEEPEEAVA